MSFSLIANAVVLGSVYVVFSSGFTLVYGAFRIMNMAHGAVLTVGAFMGILAANHFGWPLALAAVFAAVAAGLLNLLMDALVIQPILRRTSSLHGSGEELTPVVATLAVVGIATGVLYNVVTGVGYVFENAGTVSGTLRVGSLHVSVLDVTIVLAAIVVSVGINLYINRSAAGVRVRAVAEDRYMAAALGVRPNVTSAGVFFISGALAGLTGMATGLLYNNVSPAMGEPLLLFGFIIVTVGGIGSLTGTIIASFIVAFVRVFAANHFSVPVVTMMLFGILLLTLLIRPSGIMGARVLGGGVSRT
ncbi:branched-chain amino acid ABC transporter permease [Dactylosporangium salmoneum]|uniref:Branched-chain amino acid ABC transporter permease n=1 Tax=Dactylosporangium salmoneum TaxID=53361 RepID=A0ABP5SVN5_9ACTN